MDTTQHPVPVQGGDIALYLTRIARLTPPRDEREAQLLELYEQLLEKHGPRRAPAPLPRLPADAA